MMPTIRVDDEVMAALASKVQRPFRDTPNDVLRRLLALGESDPDGGNGTRHREKGRFLPMAMYRKAILQVLSHREDGRATVPTMMKLAGGKLRSFLTADDLKPIKSGTIRWENRLMWERLNMVKEGLLKADSPRGVWEITAKGREYLKTQAKGGE